MLRAEYHRDEDGITITFAGEESVLVEERFDAEAGEMRWFASNVKASQKDETAALDWAARNVGTKALAEFRKSLNPPGSRKSVPVSLYQAAQDELAAAREELARLRAEAAAAPVKAKAAAKK